MSVDVLPGCVLLALAAQVAPLAQAAKDTPAWTTPVITALAAFVAGFAAIAGTRFKGRTEVSDKFRDRVFGGKAKLRALYFQPEFGELFRDVFAELSSFDIDPGDELPSDAVDAVIGRAEWAARVTRLNGWLTREGDLDRNYVELKRLQGVILVALGLLSAWCMVGDLSLVLLLVSGRLGDDWVVFVAGVYGALFLGAVAFALGAFIAAYRTEARLEDTLAKIEGGSDG